MMGEPPRMEWLAVADLHLDASYQRDIKTRAAAKVIDRIARDFSWAKFQCLTVAKRPSGKCFVVDGQHRLMVVRRLHIASVPCVVFDVASSRAEAQMFSDINRVRRTVSALDLHKAAVAAGDDAALLIEAVLARADMQVAPHSNFTAWQPSHVSALGALRSCIRLHGETATEAALIGIQDAWPGQVIRTMGELLPGIAKFYASALMDDTFDVDSFVALIGRSAMADWSTRATAIMREKGLSRPDALAGLLRKAALEARLLGQKLPA